MKKSLFVFFLCLMSFASTNAQTSTSNTKTTVASPDSNVNFRLYQTNNRWTFLKLDTRTGVIMHVQYSTDSDAMQYELNSMPLAEGEDAKSGRFLLYPTENTFNFIKKAHRILLCKWNSKYQVLFYFFTMERR